MRDQGRRRAIQIIKKENLSTGELELVRQEAKILHTLEHPNIVKFKQLKETKDFVFIVMELANGHSLKHYLTQRIKHHRSPLAD